VLLLLLLSGCSCSGSCLSLGMLLSGEVRMLLGMMACLLLVEPRRLVSVLVLVREDMLL
jgi:hypothetical protein